MTASTVDPTLADDEIDELLAEFAVVDASGFAPGDGSWTPTYDLASAAAAGWLVKAGRASTLVDVDTSGAAASKVFDNCHAMAKSYRARCSMAVQIGTAD